MTELPDEIWNHILEFALDWKTSHKRKIKPILENNIVGCYREVYERWTLFPPYPNTNDIIYSDINNPSNIYDNKYDSLFNKYSLEKSVVSTKNIKINNEWYTKIYYKGVDCIDPLKMKKGGLSGYSNYNSKKHAKSALEDLIKHTNASYIILSYNDGGIIPIPELDTILKDFASNVEKIPITHKTYNRLKGI